MGELLGDVEDSVLVLRESGVLLHSHQKIQTVLLLDVDFLEFHLVGHLSVLLLHCLSVQEGFVGEEFLLVNCLSKGFGVLDLVIEGLIGGSHK